MKLPLVVPEEFHRNAPDVHAAGPENTGAILIGLALRRLGLADLRDVDVLDVGCGVRFTQTILNRHIPVKSYTGIDVHRPLIEYLQREVEDPRFVFAHWNALNARYNPAGTKLSRQSSLPVAGAYDVIWLFSVFTHLDPSDASALLTILRRHVRAQGILFFSAFIDDAVDGFEERVPEHPLAQPSYTESYMHELVSGSGWNVSSVHPASREHFIQHHFVCRPK